MGKETKNALALLEKSRANVNGLINSSFGKGAESIYKDELLEGLSDKQKKSLRKKLRTYLFAVCSNIISTNDKEKRNALINAFNEFYKDFYKLNDYSLNSVCSDNLKEDKKTILKNALAIISSNTPKGKK